MILIQISEHSDSGKLKEFLLLLLYNNVGEAFNYVVNVTDMLLVKVLLQVKQVC